MTNIHDDAIASFATVPSKATRYEGTVITVHEQSLYTSRAFVRSASFGFDIRLDAGETLTPFLITGDTVSFECNLDWFHNPRAVNVKRAPSAVDTPTDATLGDELYDAADNGDPITDADREGLRVMTEARALLSTRDEMSYGDLSRYAEAAGVDPDDLEHCYIQAGGTVYIETSTHLLNGDTPVTVDDVDDEQVKVTSEGGSAWVNAEFVRAAPKVITAIEHAITVGKTPVGTGKQATVSEDYLNALADVMAETLIVLVAPVSDPRDLLIEAQRTRIRELERTLSDHQRIADDNEHRDNYRFVF